MTVHLTPACKADGSPESLVISDAYHQNRINTSGILLGMKEYLALLFHRQAGRTKLIGKDL
jgi:hypothetical protein